MLGCSRWWSTTIPCGGLINPSSTSPSRYGSMSYSSNGLGGPKSAAAASRSRRRSHAAITGSAEAHSSSRSREEEEGKRKKKVSVIGSGWAGLGAAHHLCNQGFEVTVFEDGNGFGSSDNAGIIQGFWYPYKNIFSLVDELGIKPFTNWMKSAVYSSEGLEVEFPVFQDLQQLPAPLGTLLYTQFKQLPWVDRLSSLPLMAAVIDFDNTEMAWRKYDSSKILRSQFHMWVSFQQLRRLVGCSSGLIEKVGLVD